MLQYSHEINIRVSLNRRHINWNQYQLDSILSTSAFNQIGHFDRGVGSPLVAISIMIPPILFGGFRHADFRILSFLLPALSGKEKSFPGSMQIIRQAFLARLSLSQQWTNYLSCSDHNQAVRSPTKRLVRLLSKKSNRTICSRRNKFSNS